MKKLAVCIPNYNRPQKLHALIKELARQIAIGDMVDKVEICINDDCSPESPVWVIEDVKKEYPEVDIAFGVNERNMGMDYNFLNCVKMSDAEYCWIVGNDDLPEENAIQRVLYYLDDEYVGVDLLVSPFDVYDEKNNVLRTVYPLKDTSDQILYYDSSKIGEYDALIGRVTDGNGLFCFLSNVIFKKGAWIRHGDMFRDKMNSIFIQMYMNLQTMKEGAVYKYVPEKLIKDYVDDEVNATFKREYNVLVGLNGVIDYFFEGANHRKLQKCIVDERINGRMWDLPNESPLKQNIVSIESPKNELYKKYFVYSWERAEYFNGKDVLVYGAGNLGRKAVLELETYSVNSLRVFDADSNKWGNKIEGYEICSVETLYSIYKAGPCAVVVANCRSLVEIVEVLRENGIEKISIIT